MNIVEVKRKLDEIALAKGNKEKAAVIKKYKDDEDFVFLLEFLFNPYKTTGIAEKKINKKLAGVGSYGSPHCMKDLIAYILNNNTGNDFVIGVVQEFIELYKEHEEFIKEVLTKTYKCGVSSTTINKVIPNLIPTFGVMLATKIEEVKGLDNKIIIATKKIDGFRCTIIKSKGVIKSFNRSGIQIEGLIEIENEIKNLPDGVYDGELVAIGEFKEAKDQYKATSKLARKKGEKRGLKLIAFDYIKYVNDFLSGICYTECIKRKEELAYIINKTYLQFIENAEILYHDYYDEEKIMKLNEILTDVGEEGTMLNIANAPYECKRTKTLIKIKKFYTCDLRVVGYTEGKGEFKGTLGSFTVEYKNNTVNVPVLKELQRIEYWKNKEEMIGKIIEVGYREETHNEDGKPSLRFPSFKCVRYDKDDVSYN